MRFWRPWTSILLPRASILAPPDLHFAPPGLDFGPPRARFLNVLGLFLCYIATLLHLPSRPRFWATVDRCLVHVWLVFDTVSQIFHYISMFFTNTVMELIFKGLTCQPKLKSMILDAFCDPGRHQNRPLGRLLSAKKRKGRAVQGSIFRPRRPLRVDLTKRKIWHWDQILQYFDSLPLK